MNFHNHALFQTADNWHVYRNLHLGANGPAGSEYIAIRLADQKRFDFPSQKRMKQWFAEAGIEFPTFEKANDWHEIKHG